MPINPRLPGEAGSKTLMAHKAFLTKARRAMAPRERPWCHGPNQRQALISRVA
jgi:hypothetical protein